jgi:hypothetical protein
MQNFEVSSTLCKSCLCPVEQLQTVFTEVSDSCYVLNLVKRLALLPSHIKVTLQTFMDVCEYSH